MLRKPKVYDNVPNFDYWAGRLATKILGILTKRALDRKDYHEFNHSFLGIYVANSYHIKDYMDTCIVPSTRFIHSGEEFKITLPKPSK